MIGVGLVGFYSAVSSLYGPGEHGRKEEVRRSGGAEEGKNTDRAIGRDTGYSVGNRDTGVHLPNRKPTDSKMERFIGRGG